MNLEKKIRDCIVPILQELNIELVDLKVHGTRGNQVLRIFIDAENGVTVKDCTDASRAISDILDIEDLIPNRYRLEVSSPGIDRPLTNERDFRRNLNRNVKIVYKTDETVHTVQGNIEAVQPGKVIINTEQQTAEIPIQTIEKAKIVLKW